MATRKTKRTAGTSSARGRGSYASQACDVCRSKKVKCDEVKPVCGYCTSSGRDDECSWTGESIRKPRTEAHFTAMRKRLHALESYADLLETMVERCRVQHGSIDCSYMEHRPYDNEMDEDTPEADRSADEDIGELCAPTQYLKLENKELVLYGMAAPFRFLPEGQPTKESRFPEINSNPDHCYVLLVDGADQGHHNPDFDWSRHLPLEVPLTRLEHDKILDKLFKFFTCWGMRIVPALFLRDMYRTLSVPRSQGIPKTSHYSPMLHNALIALATAYSDDSFICDPRSRQYFAIRAKSLLDSECQKPNICVVHALSILGSYHSSNGDQTLGYIYGGMSARASQALGLGVDCSTWVKSGLISYDDMLDRNWAYWTTFSQDVCWTLYVGREFCISIPSDKQSIPIPFVDAKYDETPWHYGPSNIAPQPSYLSATFASSCSLLMISRKVMDIVNSTNLPGVRQQVRDDLTSQIDLELHTWKSNLPPYVDIPDHDTMMTSTPHRLMTHLAFWWTFIILHRPSLHIKKKTVSASGKDIDHMAICHNAADKIMELLGAWKALYTVRYVPMTYIQVVFSAGTIYLVLCIQAVSGLRLAEKSLKSHMAQLESCLLYLDEVVPSFSCALKVAGALRHLIQQHLKPLLAKRETQKRGIPQSPAFLSGVRLPHATPDHRIPAPDQAFSMLPNPVGIPHPSPSAPLNNFHLDNYGNLESMGFLSSDMPTFLAMLGGESLPDTPFTFIPTFSSPEMFDQSVSAHRSVPSASSLPTFEQDPRDIPPQEYNTVMGAWGHSFFS